MTVYTQLSSYAVMHAAAGEAATCGAGPGVLHRSISCGGKRLDTEHRVDLHGLFHDSAHKARIACPFPA